ARYKLMTLDADEFIRRFLIHVLPDGFHRIRHYGLFANGNRANNIALARRLLGAPDPARWSADADRADGSHEDEEWNIFPCCGGRMLLVAPSGPGAHPRLGPIPATPFNTSCPPRPCRHPTLPPQFHADVSSATPALRQSQLSVPPSTAKTEIAHYKTTVPIL